MPIVAAAVAVGICSCSKNELGKSAETVKKIQTDLYCMTVSGAVAFDSFIANGGASSSREVGDFLSDYLSAGPWGTLKTKIAPGGFACSALKVRHNTGGWLVGRNYDWDDCTSLIIRNVPGNGYYSSLSTVNLNFLGFGDGYKPEGMIDSFKATAGR